MKIYCCACELDIEAVLTSGKEIYPHRPDLHSLPFWKCDTCHNYVGCHHKTGNPTHPLGNIPTPELKKLRTIIHRRLDPLWKNGRYKRKELYKLISDNCGIKSYHTAMIKSVDEANAVYKFLKNLPPKWE